ncbi:MAG: NAD-dependent epimerase/dehydratase family protein [Anaeromyxobacteraceae bacterium]
MNNVGGKHGAKGVAGPRRVGLLGAGYIADWHARALRSVPGVELAAVCDTVEGRARALAGKHGILGVHTSLEAMLAGSRLDAVHVLLPPDGHFAAARQALSAGVHVWMEKPMCPSSAECAELARTAREAGLSLGVGHNFLYAEPFERLRTHLRQGDLGRLDHVTVTWNRELPQATHGPFDAWMLARPDRILLEIGSHSVAHLLDLLGEPESLDAEASNAIDLPNGQPFFRRWSVNGHRGPTAFDLRFSFVPGFAEHSIHVRGSLGSATVDLDRNTFAMHRHEPLSEDFDRHAMVTAEARSLASQARRTLGRYVLAKARLAKRGNPYEASIASSLESFYGALGGELDDRISAETGARVIAVCERIVERSGATSKTRAAPPARAAVGKPPRVLVIGATGFIGRELVRQLVAGGEGVRVLARSPSKLPRDLVDSPVDIVAGNLESRESLLQAMKGIECVFHLARPDVKAWSDWQRHEIEATRGVAEAALESGVQRFIYTGTIDSYYAGSRAGTITEETPLDPSIHRRNLYARAKAASEALLWDMHRTRRLPLVVVRPGIVIGRGGSPFHWGVGMWWYGSVCETWGPGRNKLPLVLVEDVASGLVATLRRPGIEGQSFNLIADPYLSAQEYLDELDKAGSMRIRRKVTSPATFYAIDMAKWVVKVAVRHSERRLPSYRDWESRTQRAFFDCTRTKQVLGWNPVSDRNTLVQRGIVEPLRDILR